MQTLTGVPSPAHGRGWTTLARIVGAGLLVGAAAALTQTGVHRLRGTLPPGAYYPLFLLASALVACVAYRAYVRYGERRPVSELDGGLGAAGELAAGIGAGAALVALVVGLLWLLGAYRLAGGTVGIALLAAAANDGAGAVVEELLLRAIVFRLADGAIGTRGALLVSALLFGLLHAGQSATVPAALAAGVFLSAAYALTRRVWLPIGLHFGWDFAQDGVFGLAAGATGVVRATVAGPPWLSGGMAGLEGSVLAHVVLLVAAASVLIGVRRRGHFRSPSWRGWPPRAAVEPSPVRADAP